MLKENSTKLSYNIIWNLLYYKDTDKEYWLCISFNFHKKVFLLTHNSMSHSDYTKTHKKLMKSLYIHNLSKHLHNYIQHCSQCQLMQTSHYWSYKSLQLILTLSQFFHIITVNFILTLLITSEEYDSILSVMNKFSKTVSFISEKKIITEED